MEYYQVWLAVHPQHQLGRIKIDPPDEPIKHPCASPYGNDSVLEEALGAVNVQEPTPAFFVKDPTVWELLRQQAQLEKRPVADVLAAAIHAYAGPAGPVLHD